MNSELPIKGEDKRVQIPGKILLIILTGVCIILMISTYYLNAFSGVFRTVGGVLVTPFQKGVTIICSWLNDQSDRFESIEKLKLENAELQTQLDTLRTEITALQQERYELSQLRALFSLSSQYEDYTKVGARIIAKDVGNWYHSFIIDKGTNDGLDVDMNVIAGSGLVGRITEIGPDWSRVMSVIADNSSISGMVLSTADNLIVDGSLELFHEGYISFSKLTDNAGEVSIGDKIVTSNVSDKYLPNILIGYITEIKVDANSLTKSGYLTPAVDFEHLETVLVIVQTKKITVE